VLLPQYNKKLRELRETPKAFSTKRRWWHITRPS